MSIEERYYRLRDTTHVVRIEDMSVYRIQDIKCLDDVTIFVEVDDGLFFQDLDVLTLEECASMEMQMQTIRDYLAK